MAEETESKEMELTERTIIDHLKKNEFKINIHWVLFMRLLGLTLDEIWSSEQSSYRDNYTELALEDCLSKLLNNDETCSWEKVNTAMNKLKTEHALKIIFHLYKQKLITAFEECMDCSGLGTLLKTLEAEEFTSTSDVDESNITGQDMFRLLSTSIEEDPNCLLKLIRILGKFTSCKEVSNDLQLECNRYNYSSPTLKRQSNTVSIPLSPTLEEHFDSVLGEFAFLKDAITEMLVSAIGNSQKQIDKFKKYLRNIRQFDDELDSCESPESLVELALMKISSLLNVAHLEKLVKIFKLQDGIVEIEKYKECKKSACEKIKANELLNVRLSEVTPLKCETVRFTVSWSADETFLKDIEKLLCLAFEDRLKCEIHVIYLEKGNSIIITCYAPESLIGLLIFKAQQNLSILKKNGVMSLTIGYCTLLNHKTDYEINKPLHEEIEQLQEEKRRQDDELLETAAKLKNMRIELEDVEKLRSIKLSEEVAEAQVKEAALLEYDSKVSESKDELEPEQKEKQNNLEQTKMALEECSQAVITEEILSDLTEQDIIQQLQRDKESLLDLLSDEKKKTDDMSKEFNYVRDGLLAQLDMEKKRTIGMTREISNLKDDKGLLKSEVSKLKQKTDDYIPLESEVSELKQKLAKKVPLLFLNSGVQHPPVTIMMSNFSNWKKRQDHWFSPAFYSHPGGYKLCLKVRASGQEEGEGTHVSVYTHIMSGENDQKLQWPFRGKIKLKLLNQRADSNHIDGEIDFSILGKEDAGARVSGGLRVPSGTAAVLGKGVVQLVKHKDLNFSPDRGTEYLREDALLICVKEVIVAHEQPSSAAAVADITEPVATFTDVKKFTLQDFSKQKAKGGKWQKKFYTHTEGYQFMLIVHANGKDEFKGKSISVFTHLMKGNHDDRLKFPFRGSITVRLINQKEDKNHVECRIKYTEETDPKGKKGGRITTLSLDNLVAGRSYNGWGYPNFAKHEYLIYDSDRNTQYITDNDELEFIIPHVDIFSI